MSGATEKLRPLICQKLKAIGCFIDDELPEYILTMIENEKKPSDMTRELSLFLGTQAKFFVDWMQEVTTADALSLSVQSETNMPNVEQSVSTVGSSTEDSVVSTPARHHDTPAPVSNAARKPVKAGSKRKAGSALRLLTLAMDGAHKDTVQALTAPKPVPAEKKPPIVRLSSGRSVGQTGSVSQSISDRLGNRRQQSSGHVTKTSTPRHNNTGGRTGVEFNVTLTGVPSKKLSRTIQNDVACGLSLPEGNTLPGPSSGACRPKTNFVVTLSGKHTPSQTSQDADAAGLTQSLKVTIPSAPSLSQRESASTALIQKTILQDSDAEANLGMLITVPLRASISSKESVSKSRVSDAVTIASSSSSDSSSNSSSSSSSSGSSNEDSESDDGMNLSLESEDESSPVSGGTSIRSGSLATASAVSRPSSVVVVARKRPSSPDKSNGVPAKVPRKDIGSTGGATSIPSGLDVKCRKFPNCPYGQGCSFLHPECPNLGHCQSSSCAYRHPVKKAQASSTSSRVYKFDAHCSKTNRPYFHSPSASMCRFGINCTRRDCPFRHPSTNRKWVRPS